MEYTEQQWADMRRWVQNWKEVGPILEQIKAEELAAMTEEDGRDKTNEALRMGDLWRLQNPDYERECGLIEQQRIFGKWTSLSV